MMTCRSWASRVTWSVRKGKKSSFYYIQHQGGRVTLRRSSKRVLLNARSLAGSMSIFDYVHYLVANKTVVLVIGLGRRLTYD